MPFSESLVVRILGDSSGLRQELESAAEEIDRFGDRLAAADDFGARLADSFHGLESALGPLQQVSQQLERIRNQLASLSGTVISLNVAPALGALQQLSAAIQQAAAMLRGLSSLAGAQAVSSGNSGGGSVRGFAAGGLVSGPAGIDRVPAQLTAGEFVLNVDAVRAVGLAALDRLNRGAVSDAAGRNHTRRPAAIMTYNSAPPAVATSDPAGTSVQQTNNHFGGISIQVRELADAAGVLGELRRQGIGLRVRRG